MSVRWCIPLLALAGACSDDAPDALPAPGHLVIHVDTDAIVPPAPGEAPNPARPAALFDRLRVEIYEPGSADPCEECSREFAIDEGLLRAGATFTLEPGKNAKGLVARLRLFRAASVLEGRIPPEATIEAFAGLPAAPAQGALDVSVELPTDAVGTRIGAIDAPIPAEKGKPKKSRVGTWPGGQRVECAGAPGPGEVCIPGGAFWMGNPVVYGGEGYNGADKLRLVVLAPFFLDAHETTVAEYRAIGLQVTSNVVPWSGDEGGDAFQDWCSYTVMPGAREDLPVNCLYYAGATAYCTGHGAALPTEAQLEYVYGALESRTYVWGNDDPTCDDVVFARGGGGILGDTPGDCRPSASIGGPVALGPSPAMAAPPRARDFLVLPTGTLFDLAGNLSEWTADRFNTQDEPCWAQQGANVFQDPVCDQISPSQGDTRTVRGGSWLLDQRILRAAFRDRGDPVNAFPMVGVRCMRPGI